MKHFLKIVLTLMNSLLLGFDYRVENMIIQLKNLGQRIEVLSIPVLFI